MEFKKKNATILCVYGLYKMKKVENSINSMNAIIKMKNVLSYYFFGMIGKLNIRSTNV